MGWIKKGKLDKADMKGHNKEIGLYRLSQNGATKYIGRAIEENNGGFRKRISDYRRESHSARKHNFGKLINQNMSNLDLEIMPLGNTRADREKVKKVEKAHKDYPISRSMSRAGTPTDNPVIESLIGWIKGDLKHYIKMHDFKDINTAIELYID